MNEEETYMGEWPVKPYYKRDLAMGYAPDITPVSYTHLTLPTNSRV
mgnify:CR=1 FL=1